MRVEVEMCDSHEPEEGADSAPGCQQDTFWNGQTDPFRCMTHDAFWSSHSLTCSGKDSAPRLDADTWPLELDIDQQQQDGAQETNPRTPVDRMIEEWLPEATRSPQRRDRPRWMDRDLSRDETGREPF